MNTAAITNITIPSFKPSNSGNEKNCLHFYPAVSVKLYPIISLSLEEGIPPNALKRKRDSSWRGGFSLGVDLGFARTGLAISKGFSVRPLNVLELRGQKLELQLLDIAQRQEVDEFIIGLPKSSDGRETPQSNKVRSVAGRLAVRAAERGLKKSARRDRLDAYAAVMVLERYFSLSGQEVQLVLPKRLDLQARLRGAAREDVDFL